MILNRGGARVFAGGGGGGTPTHFSDLTFVWQIYHNLVGVLSSSPYVTEMTKKIMGVGEIAPLPLSDAAPDSKDMKRAKIS